MTDGYHTDRASATMTTVCSCVPWHDEVTEGQAIGPPQGENGGFGGHVHGYMFSRSAASDSLRPYGLQPARLLCPWDSPGKNTGVGCHFLLQGIFST